MKFLVLVVAALHLAGQADVPVVRLQPSSFPALSSGIRRDLEKRGCTVPQNYANKTPHNVIRGRFTSPKEYDTAVLCSKGSVSSILVYRGGSVRQVSEIADVPDERFMEPSTGYSRSLTTVNAEDIRRQTRWLVGPRPSLDHEGIHDSFLKTASVVWFWSDGEWHRMQGLDE